MSALDGAGRDPVHRRHEVGLRDHCGEEGTSCREAMEINRRLTAVATSSAPLAALLLAWSEVERRRPASSSIARAVCSAPRRHPTAVVERASDDVAGATASTGHGR